MCVHNHQGQQACRIVTVFHVPDGTESFELWLDPGHSEIFHLCGLALLELYHHRLVFGEANGPRQVNLMVTVLISTSTAGFGCKIFLISTADLYGGVLP